MSQQVTVVKGRSAFGAGCMGTLGVVFALVVAIPLIVVVFFSGCVGCLAVTASVTETHSERSDTRPEARAPRQAVPIPDDDESDQFRTDTLPSEAEPSRPERSTEDASQTITRGPIALAEAAMYKAINATDPQQRDLAAEQAIKAHLAADEADRQIVRSEDRVRMFRTNAGRAHSRNNAVRLRTQANELERQIANELIPLAESLREEAEEASKEAMFYNWKHTLQLTRNFLHLWFDELLASMHLADRSTETP